MYRLRIIDFGYHAFNGFEIKLFDIEAWGFEGALLGFSFGYKSFLVLDILFINIEIKSPVRLK